MTKPFDFINSINFGKTDIMVGPDEEKVYNSFLTNRGLSYFEDTVLLANEMNRYHQLDSRMQYDFLRTAVRKRKRFSKWIKPEQNADVETVMEHYNYSREKAEAVMDLITPESIDKMRSLKGGKTK